MSQGKVKWFNNKKGFGFIIGEDGTDYFVHHTNIIGEGYKTLDTGAAVDFEVESGDKGPQATQVSAM